jgi:hypothetical protein
MLIPDIKRIRHSAYPKLDKALNIWIADLNSKAVNGDMIKEQADVLLPNWTFLVTSSSHRVG